MKRYDCYINDVANVAQIFERGDIEECGLMPCDRKPVFECEATSSDWSEWLDDNTDWRDDNARRILRRRISIPARFVSDLEKLAQSIMDDWREAGKACGWGELHIDRRYTTYTYRASADWKNEPTLYTFDNVFTWDGIQDMTNAEDRRARRLHTRLAGMADAVHELGMTLVFDSDFKVRIMGAFAEWHAVED